MLDEPTVGVDPQSRYAILSKIAEFGATGMAILYTTHYMEEAERLADRLVVIDRGTVVANDTLAGLYARVPPPASGERVSLESVFLSLTGKNLRD